MLDQADYIARYDKDDALGVIASQVDQLRHVFAAPTALGDIRRLDAIVLTGMGGSALAAEFIQNWLGDRLRVPLVISRDYALPGFVNSDTLVVASSYSGNTEETLSGLEDAERRGAKIVVVAAGGKLLERAKSKKYPYFELPGGLQPRLAVLYGVRAWAQLFESMDLFDGLVDELVAAAKWMTEELTGWEAGVPTADNAAKQIANELVGHPVVMYGGPTLRLPTMKWKIDLNENGKNIAFFNNFPELDHNEFTGWLHPEKPGLKVVELRSNLDHPQVVRRFDATNKLLSNRFAPIEVAAQGKTKLEQMVWTLILGDFVSAYLAFLNGVNPMPVDLVEKLKTELA